MVYRFKGVVGNGSTWVARCSLLSSTDTEELGKYTDPEKAAEAVDVMTLHLGVSPEMPHKNFMCKLPIPSILFALLLPRCMKGVIMQQ